MLQSIRRQLVAVDGPLSSDQPYAIFIGAAVGVVSTLLVVVGLVLYCRERRRHKELELEPYVDLPSTVLPVDTHLSSDTIASATTRTLFHNVFDLQHTQSMSDLHHRFYLVTSPIATRVAAPLEPEHQSIHPINPSSHRSLSLCRMVQQPIDERTREAFGQSSDDPQEPNSLHSSATTHIGQQLWWSHDSHKSCCCCCSAITPHVNRTHSNNSSNSNNSSSNHRHGTDSSAPPSGLWQDPAIVAVRLPMDKVTIGALVSRGAFGQVFRGTYNRRPVAIKRLLPDARKDVAQIHALLAEVKLHAALEHERVVQCIGVAYDALADLCAVSEFMPGGDLRALLVTWATTECHPTGFDVDKAHIALDVAQALTYLHSLAPAVLHRDLKSNNILLDSDRRAKVSDFGVARKRTDGTLTGGVGTCLWMAPEVMLGDRYNDKADVFSLGIVLSELDAHALPYAGATSTETGRVLPPAAVLQLVASDELHVSFTTPMAAAGAAASGAWRAMAQLGAACVAFAPEDRPTAAQATYQLQLIVRAFAQTDVAEEP
ncbi:unnamed protein product [Hyaloperonospora brassicae]|uniref:Protein kinase domain-containing protein n=1 Tax=Hyaloperonospora brassicae TaxID=162125 RepID=A0AAV0TB01_HYABA|nr:unnamed protein product [Hyaloperonospora brassicae]